MGKCKRCGKFSLWTIFHEGHVCGNCAKELSAELIAQRKELESKLAYEREESERKEKQDKANAKAQYDYVTEIYQASLLGYKAASVKELQVAIDYCNKFDSALTEFAAMPASDFILQSLLISSYGFYELPGLGYVNIERKDGDQPLIKFTKQEDKIKSAIQEYQTLLDATNHFNDIEAAIHRSIIELRPDIEPIQQRNLPIIKTSNIVSTTPVSILNNFYVVDVETTGLSPIDNEIIEITAVHYLNAIPTEAFSTYIKPRKGLNKESQEINHITDDQIKNAPYIEQVMTSFQDFIGSKAPLVGHNISFDINFLVSSGMNGTIIAKRKIYDTLELSKRVFSLPRNNLPYLCRTVLKILRDDAHDSLSDAIVTGELFKEIFKMRVG